MKTLRNILAVLALTLVSFSCTADMISEEANVENASSLRFHDGGGDDDIVDETEKDDE